MIKSFKKASLSLAAIPVLLASMPSQAVTVEQLNQQVQRMNQRISEQDKRFQVNGFASFGFAIADEEMPYNGINDEVSFNSLSKAGVQMTFNMDSQNSVVMQLVSRGKNDWDTSAEWAYFKHDFDSGLSGKIGRIRLPAYLLSEFLDVGYAVPYALMPAETYNSLDSFANMDGFDLSYSMDVGENTATFQFVYGRSTDVGFDLKDIIGLNGVFQTDTWSTRLAYHQSSNTLLDPETISAFSLYGGDTTGIDGSFTSLGFSYDPGDVYFTTEFTKQEVDGEVADVEAFYATLGYRFGRYLPTITFATSKSTDDDERDISQISAQNAGAITIATAAAAQADGTATAEQTALLGAVTAQQITDSVAGAPLIVAGVETVKGLSNRDTQRIGLGLRYDMSAGTALKIQYDIITVDNGRGLFDATAWTDNFVTGGANPEGTNILTVTIDTVF